MFAVRCVLDRALHTLTQNSLVKTNHTKELQLLINRISTTRSSGRGTNRWLMRHAECGTWSPRSWAYQSTSFSSAFGNHLKSGLKSGGRNQVGEVFEELDLLARLILWMGCNNDKVLSVLRPSPRGRVVECWCPQGEQVEDPSNEFVIGYYLMGSFSSSVVVPRDTRHARHEYWY